MREEEGWLTEAAGRVLVEVARRSLEAFVRHQTFYEPARADLQAAVSRPGATFVTLTQWGELRGCIGTVQAYRDLVSDVAQNAVAAASRDPRFVPVAVEELKSIRLSVSVLTPPKKLIYSDYEDLLAKLRPEVDGVVLSWQARRSLLLPQVWERIADPAQFLRSLCLKGHIPEKELRVVPPTVTVSTFQAQHFYEEGYLEPGGKAPTASRPER